MLTSATMAGGASSANERHKSDFYQTPEECTIALMKHLPHWRQRITWEPACGDGAISRVLTRMGCPMVVNSDYRPTMLPGITVRDFIGSTLPLGVQQIVTNPPFNRATEFIEQAASFKVPFAFLLKVQFFHVERNRKLFTETGPLAVLPMSWRPAMAPERGDNPTMEFVWCVWDRAPAPHCYYYPLVKPK